MNDHLQTAITEAKQDYQKTCKSLDIDYLIFNKVGKNMCKKQGVSPDAVMQLGFQVIFKYQLPYITAGKIEIKVHYILTGDNQAIY